MGTWVVRGTQADGKTVKYFDKLSYDEAMRKRAQFNQQGYLIVAVMRDRRGEMMNRG